MYTIDYGTGAGNTTHGTLEEALGAVNPSYTQTDIYIVDADGQQLYRMPWWGVAYDPGESDEEPFAAFGDYGYYGQWTEL